MKNSILNNKILCIVGLGYVGLPLAISFSKHFNVIGFDININRINALMSGYDSTNETSFNDLDTTKLLLTNDSKKISKAEIFIIAVPTPIDSHNNPDLTPVINATKTVASNMSIGSIICYESTVYPGVTEDICIPILEKYSKFQFGKDFTVGYSPERINPGDKVHRLETIKKIVSGSDDYTTDILCDVYGSIVKAGIHRASSIKVAEAAKVIENTQRDINIAFMNELSIIFNKMGIDTLEVLEAAGTKWNFLPFRPGLVGGHCIGVDPYYLTYKAEELGYHPEVILSGRRINDNMGKYVAEKTVKELIKIGKQIKGARVGILGFTFKENVPDIRNTRVIDIIDELSEYGISSLIYDPLVDKNDVENYYNFKIKDITDFTNLDLLIIAVPHNELLSLNIDQYKRMFADNKYFIFDIKGVLNKYIYENNGFKILRL